MGCKSPRCMLWQSAQLLLLGLSNLVNLLCCRGSSCTATTFFDNLCQSLLGHGSTYQRWCSQRCIWHEPRFSMGLSHSFRSSMGLAYSCFSRISLCSWKPLVPCSQRSSRTSQAFSQSSRLQERQGHQCRRAHLCNGLHKRTWNCKSQISVLVWYLSRNQPSPYWNWSCCLGELFSFVSHT